MPYTIEQFPDEPIIVVTQKDPFDAVNDSMAVAAFLLDALEKSNGDLYLVGDMTGISISFSDLVAGMAAAYATPGSPYTNPRLKTFTVATSKLLELGAKAAAEQRQYGNANVKLYATRDEALNEIRKILSGK